VIPDSSDNDEAASADQPTRGDAASSSQDPQEEECQVHLEAERRSKFNTERVSRRPETEAPHCKGPTSETLAPLPSASALPGKRGSVEHDAL
jgi:hypothetical protein